MELSINICLSAHRVVDEKIAIDRHFTEAELQEYYKFNPDESITDEQNTSDEQQNSSQGGQVRPSGVTMRLGPPKVCVNFQFKYKYVFAYRTVSWEKYFYRMKIALLITRGMILSLMKSMKTN